MVSKLLRRGFEGRLHRGGEADRADEDVDVVRDWKDVGVDTMLEIR